MKKTFSAMLFLPLLLLFACKKDSPADVMAKYWKETTKNEKAGISYKMKTIPESSLFNNVTYYQKAGKKALAQSNGTITINKDNTLMYVYNPKDNRAIEFEAKSVKALGDLFQKAFSENNKNEKNSALSTGDFSNPALNITLGGTDVVEGEPCQKVTLNDNGLVELCMTKYGYPAYMKKNGDSRAQIMYDFNTNVPDGIFELPAGTKIITPAELLGFGKPPKEEKTVVVLSPENKQAGEYYDVGNYYETIKAASGVITRNPANAQAFMLRAQAEEMLGTYKQALADYEAVLKITPSDKDALYRRAVVLYKTKDFKSAVTAFNNMLSVYPDYYNALILAGNAAQRANNAALAAQYYKKTFDSEGGDTMLGKAALEKYAQAKFVLGNYTSGCEEDLVKNTRFCQEVELNKGRGQMSFFADNTRDYYKKIEMETARAGQDSSGMTDIVISAYWDNIGNFDKALQSLKTAEVKVADPKSRNFRERELTILKRLVYFDAGQYDKALEADNAIISKYYPSGKNYRDRAYTKAAMGDLQGAQKDFDEYIKSRGGDAPPLKETDDILITDFIYLI